MGVLDLSVKIFEGIRIFFSPREHMTTRMEYPLVVHTDGRVREYDEGEARAYFLLSACSRWDTHVHRSPPPAAHYQRGRATALSHLRRTALGAIAWFRGCIAHPIPTVCAAQS
jgi:hypothetical protein